MRIKLCVAALAAALSLCAAARDYTQYVDTRVGTAKSETKAAGKFGKGSEEMGQTLPAVLVPRGMNFWTPQTRDTERKCVAPYYYADTLLQGFRNSHWIVGGCTQDYGSMTLMPQTGMLRLSPGARASRFGHADEVAKPDYYAVTLPDEGLVVALTGTSRAAIFQIATINDSARMASSSFRVRPGGGAEPGSFRLIINPNSDEGQGFIAVDTARRMVYGYNPVHRIYQGKGQPAGYSGHFVVVFDREIKEFGTYVGDTPMPGVSSIGMQPGIGCYVELDVDPGDTALVKAASSFVSHEGALANLQAEIPGWDFDEVRASLHETWNNHLGFIDVDSDDADQLGKFYGALYRASFLPHEVNDADGKYPAFSSGYPTMTLPEGMGAYYDDYSMWDTYRALHPLVTLLQPTVSGDMMQSLVLKGQQGGWLPIFPCWGSYTAAMIGDHCIAAISDAYAKGVRNFDADAAYQLMRRNAFESPTPVEYANGMGRRALPSYLAYGYVPLEDTVPHAYHKREQVSRTLEYAYDDYALAQMAKALGHDDDYAVLIDRSHNWTHVINPASGYACGRHADGSWAKEDPFAFSKSITEGAPCHYTWYVPHDPEGLIAMLGGKKKFIAKLDSLFSEGRYWHGNEPCHQIIYMYAHAGAREKTSQAVRHIMDTEYINSPGGLSGNDDAGQMSAWYVFAALGFYPVCPGSEEYVISCPTFKRIEIKLENGNTLTLIAPHAEDPGHVVKSIKHDGKPYKQHTIPHSLLLQGGTWLFE